MPLTLISLDTRFDDPDAATIAHVLGSLDGGRNVLATLERGESNYLQAEGSVQTGFALERQDGAVDRRYRSRAGGLPLAQVTEIFLGYARGDAGWPGDLEWEPISYAAPAVPWFSTWWGYALILSAVAGLIWWWRG